MSSFEISNGILSVGKVVTKEVQSTKANITKLSILNTVTDIKDVIRQDIVNEVTNNTQITNVINQNITQVVVDNDSKTTGTLNIGNYQLTDTSGSLVVNKHTVDTSGNAISSETLLEIN